MKHSAVSHRGSRTHPLAGVVAGLKVNAVAAADFQPSSLFAVAGKALWSSTPLVLSQIYSRTLPLLPATRVIDDTLGVRLTHSLV